MFENCSDSSWGIFQRCDCDLPRALCALANICGYCSTIIWFVVLLPQVLRSFRHRSVEGVSPMWAILNFTAAMNNTFFIFKLGNMPWYTYGSAVYMPVLEMALLLMFVAFTPRTTRKLVTIVICVIIWTTIIIAQIFFNVYGKLEWISIALWSAETFPQILLNMERQSTYGLSTLSVAITTIGKTTDFIDTYLLIMPMQYVVMAFFSSTMAQIQTVQVLWYWNQRPMPVEKPVKMPTAAIARDDILRPQSPPSVVLVQSPISTVCHVVRYVGIAILAIELAIFAVALRWRTGHWVSLLAPVFTYSLVIAGFYPYCAYRRYRDEKKRKKDPHANL